MVLPADAKAIAAEALLHDAATSRKQRPDNVLAALSALEDLHKSRTDVSGTFAFHVFCRKPSRLTGVYDRGASPQTVYGFCMEAVDPASMQIAAEGIPSEEGSCLMWALTLHARSFCCMH